MQRNPERGFSRLIWKGLVIVTTIVIFLHVNGDPVRAGGIALSNFFVLLFALPHVEHRTFFQRFPREYLLPLCLLVALVVFDLIGGSSGQAQAAIQAAAFLFFPYFVRQRGLSAVFVGTAFFFILTSQIWLLIIYGGTLPVGDLGGFFVSHRTVHSLALGAFATLFFYHIKRERWRIVLLTGIAGLLLLSQARGAAIGFLISSLAFGGDYFSLRSRISAAVSCALAITLLMLLQRDLVEHYEAMLSISGGSSTGYRTYLLAVLFDEIGRYWLAGLPDSEVQYLLADRFTGGRADYNFALDNSFTFVALSFGLFPLTLLTIIAVRMISFSKPYLIYLVVWFFLDDVLGSALGWLLLGQAMIIIQVAAREKRQAV